MAIVRRRRRRLLQFFLSSAANIPLAASDTVLTTESAPALRIGASFAAADFIVTTSSGELLINATLIASDQITVSEVANLFVGRGLNSDDVTVVNSAGIELKISPGLHADDVINTSGSAFLSVFSAGSLTGNSRVFITTDARLSLTSDAGKRAAWFHKDKVRRD